MKVYRCENAPFIDVRLRLATNSHKSHTFDWKNFFLNMENKSPEFRTLFTGNLVDLIENAMANHTVFDDVVNHMCLFTSKPTRFFLVPGSIEHAYYALLFTMLEHCEKYEHMVLQMGNEQHIISIEFKTKFTAGDGNTYSTIMNHTKLYRTLQTFAQQKIGSLNITLMAYN